MSSFFRNPKKQMILALFLILLVAFFKMDFLTNLKIAFFCIGFTVLADSLLNYLKLKKFVLSTSAIITGQILTLIIDPSAQWYQILTITAAAMAGKIFLRPKTKHIFNPAATGLSLGFILFGLYPSWWAPTLFDTNSFFAIGNLLIFLTIFFAGYLSCIKYRRLRAVLAYFATALLLTLLIPSTNTLQDKLETLFNPGTFFYSFIMLAEPMTSPMNKKFQIPYGIFVGSVSALLVYLSTATTLPVYDASIIALLLGNLIFFKFR